MARNYDAMGTPNPDLPANAPVSRNNPRGRRGVLIERGGRGPGGRRRPNTYGTRTALGDTGSGPTTYETRVQTSPGQPRRHIPPTYETTLQRAEGADVGRYTATTGQGGTGYYDPAGQSPPVGQRDILPPEEEARRARLKAMASRRTRGRAYTQTMAMTRANAMYNMPNEPLG
jgi:hypothetical protein